MGGLLALDATSVGQFMISRPLVAGVIAGALTGDPMSGLVIGSMLELYHIVTVPSGGARVPDTGPATVAAVSAGVWAGGAPGALAIAWCLGLLWGEVGGWAVMLQRRLNGAILQAILADRPTAAGLELAHTLSILTDLVRGSLLTAVGIVVGITVLPGLAADWPLDPNWTVGLILAGASVPLGILLRGFDGWNKRRTLFLIGLAIGVAGAYVT